MSRKIRVKVHAGSRKQEAIELSTGEIEVWVTQAPEKGRANKAVIKLIAEFMRVPQSSVRLIRGETSRQKTFEIDS